MKRNKKRALLSAIAMLVVSAITLSSATFAWFTVGDQATIAAITASVQTESSIEISYDAAGPWGGTLSVATLTGRGDNSFPKSLTAISVDAKSPSMNFFKGDLQNTKIFTSSIAGAADKAERLVKFTFYIRSSATTDVNYKTTKLEGTALTATYVAMQVGSSSINAAGATPAVFSAAANTYLPITAVGSGTDNNPENGIMDGPEFAGLGTAVTCNVFDGVTDRLITLTANTIRQVTVYMWLEGNDPQCSVAGGVTGDAVLTLAFVKVPVVPVTTIP